MTAWLLDSTDEIEHAVAGDTEAERETPDEMLGPADSEYRAPEEG